MTFGYLSHYHSSLKKMPARSRYLFNEKVRAAGGGRAQYDEYLWMHTGRGHGANIALRYQLHEQCKDSPLCHPNIFVSKQQI